MLRRRRRDGRGGRRPEQVRRLAQNDPADRRTDGESDAPGEGGRRHHRPIRLWSARSATSGAWTVPWRQFPDGDDCEGQGEDLQATQASAAIPAIGTINNPTAQIHRAPNVRIRLCPSRSLAIGSWVSTITSVFRRRDADSALGYAGLVLGVDRQRLELSHPGPDEDEVEGDDGHEDTVLTTSP